MKERRRTGKSMSFTLIGHLLDLLTLASLILENIDFLMCMNLHNLAKGAC